VKTGVTETAGPGRCAVARAARLALLFASLLLWQPLAASKAAAEEADGDGLYGRFDADVVLSVGAGAGASLELDPVYTVDLRARYLDSAGMVVAPEWRPQGDSAVAVLGEIRPFFLGRFLSNRSSGRRWLDLTVDSIGIELGTWIGPLANGLGAALAVGSGVDFPLSTGRSSARGLWLRLGMRYVHASHTWTDSPSEGRGFATFVACLYYRFGIDAGLARREPPRYLVR